MTSQLEALAQGIAFGAHAGQLDKAGHPYIAHVARVVARLVVPEDRVLAWLHDVLEDTAVTAEDLAAAGLPESIVVQVEALTHRKGEPRDAYYARILRWPAATRVKRADVADDSDPVRLARLDATTRARLVVKYDKARAAIGGSDV